jgi:15-cis-phytoene synthase
VAGVNTDSAYATCERITRAEARNFSYGIRLLPRTERRAMSAVYATARRIDDIGDGHQPASDKVRALAALRLRLQRLEADRTCGWGHPCDGDGSDPVLVALADAARRLPIPLPAFSDLITGCEADVTGRHYVTFAEVVDYCRHVAGSVGRLSVGVYHPDRITEASRIADDLGVALQLTNILRDLREDRRMGRVYLPQEDLERFGCSLDLDDAGELADPPDRFVALVRFEVERAEAWYTTGLRLLPMLDWRSAACTAAMAGIYHRLLHHIGADPDRVRHERLSLPTATKVSLAARAVTRRAA